MSNRPTWPLALPVAAAGVVVGIPVVDASVSTRPANLVIGSLFPGGQELVLAVVLLFAARAIALRRRSAYYLVLAMAGISALDAVRAIQLPRIALLVVTIAVAIRFRGAFTALPHAARLKTAVKAGLLTYGLAALYALVVVGADRRHLTASPNARDVGRELLSGITGTGTEPFQLAGRLGPWFQVSLGLFGAVGLLTMVAIVLSPSPPPPAADPVEREEAARLVDHADADTLAPFVLRHDKSYAFSPDHRAVIGYRVMFGIAVAGADPVGDPRSFPAAVEEFGTLASRNGWRIAVLGARADLVELWAAYAHLTIGYGDEVIVEPSGFSLAGRAMRNVRQAVQRSRNAGVTTEVVAEGDLTDHDRTALLALADGAIDGGERGFSMNLDGLLTGDREDPTIIVARDPGGRPVGFQRYLPSAHARRLSLDAMRRAKDSPNGLNERMIVDLLEHASSRHVAEVSLNFAAFRELLESADRSVPERVGYRLVHLLDPLIAVESLYLFDRKFRPRYVPRSVIISSWWSLLPAAAALLLLEFGRVKPPEEAPDPVPAHPRRTLAIRH